MSDFNESFINRVINDINDPSKGGLAANMKRADNPATEFGCWGYLISHNIDLNKEYRHYTTIMAAVAHAEPEKNGTTGLGKAMAGLLPENAEKIENSAAEAHFKRLLSADNVEEICGILRPLLKRIGRKEGLVLDYVKLLKQLQWFGNENSRKKTKIIWTTEFYRRPENDVKEDSDGK